MKTFKYYLNDEKSFVETENADEATHEGYIIEKSDMCDKGLVAYRSDLRPPETDKQSEEKGIFTTGFEFIANDNLPKMMMRKKLETGDVDILRGISLCRKASKAAYFPTYNKGKTHVYAAYIPNFFDASAFEKKEGSVSTVNFDEVLCEKIEPSQIIAAFACEILKREFDKDKEAEIVRYKIVSEELIWNESANEKKIPNLEIYKKLLKEEFGKLKKYNYLEIFYFVSGTCPVKVAGNVPAQPSPVIVSKTIDYQQELIKKVIKEIESYNQEVLGFVTKIVKKWGSLLNDPKVSVQDKMAAIEELIKGMEEIKTSVAAPVQQKIQVRIDKIQNLVSNLPKQDASDNMSKQEEKSF